MENNMTWRPAADAPKDGTFIWALDTDLSGCQLLFWADDWWCDVSGGGLYEELDDNRYWTVPPSLPVDCVAKVIEHARAKSFEKGVRIGRKRERDGLPDPE
jgi:hypothetical protein